jgi:NAD(P)-dependent dehydrogenase (short-subunit alcohol dehydrogenase family)
MSRSDPPLTVVTGGSRGIGAATVLALARAGHDVVFSYRSDTDSSERVRTAATETGRRCLPVQADVTQESDVEDLFRQAAALGPVTGLVNNAGLTGHVDDLADTPQEVIRQVIEVNLLAVILCTRRAIQLMSSHRGGQGGAIVNVSSAAATLGSPHEYVHYAAAKAGVDALTLGLAKEVAPDGIRVNAVAPGVVNTQIHADAGDPEKIKRALDRIPMVAWPSRTTSRPRSHGCSAPKRSTRRVRSCA